MAGLYPDVPGNRMALDVDGSVLFYSNSGFESVTVAEGTVKANFCNEGQTQITGGSGSGTTYFGALFPELRDVKGWKIKGSSSHNGAWWWSTDCTTPSDGTWTLVGNIPATSKATTNAGLREDIVEVDLEGIKGIRFTLVGSGALSGSRSFRGLQLYGTISEGQNEDRLRI